MTVFKHACLKLLLATCTVLLGVGGTIPAAQAALTVTPLTWNIIGLDSNRPDTGPRRFPIGARVCSDIATSNVQVDILFDSANPNINLRPGSLSSLNFASIAAAACVDAYFEAEVTAIPAAFDTQRRYHINATDLTGTYSSPTPRALYVEHLVSQSRNAITNVSFGTDPLNLTDVPPGGSMNLVVGNVYTIELTGGTATQGYEQFEAFINFTNTIFQILQVETVYSANTSIYVNSPNDSLYANACLWDNDPNSPTYRACVGTPGRTGGNNVVTTYTIRIIGGGGTTQTLNTLLYDFSGSSFHYNSDFSFAARTANIIDPTTAGISKSFSPNPVPVNGVSALTVTLTNPNPGPLSGYNFIDNLPAGMTVATPPNISLSGCGPSALLTAPAGATSLVFSDGTVAANGSCVIRVNVTTNATGSYLNDTENLFIDGIDTGRDAQATLTVNTDPPPGTGICGLTFARWDFPTGFSLTNPVATLANIPASAFAGAGIVPNSQTTITADGTSAWGSNGSIGIGATLTTANNDYFEFAVNTTGISELYIHFNALRRSANGPRGVAVYASTVNTRPETGVAIFDNATAIPTQNTPVAFGTGDSIGITTGLNPSGNTYFRVYFYNSGNTNPGSDPVVDDVLITGCSAGIQPTIAKNFSPNPIAVNGVSTLTFTLTNPNTAPLTGAAFTDSLPTGVSVAAVPAASTTCAGSPTFAPSPGSTTLSFGNPTGATIPASGSCTVSVNVTASIAGPKLNVSGFLSTIETGTNTNNVATSTLNVISPPIISKQFIPSPILAGDTSSVVLTIENPNPDNAIFGVAFNDVLPNVPGQMQVAALPNAATIGCGVPVFNPLAGATSVSFSGGSIAPADFCVISFDITANVDGVYTNITSPVSHIVGGSSVNGNSATADLVVNPPNPAIALLKEVGTSAAGPWLPFVALDLPGDVFYRFTVENTGDVALNPVSLSDPQINLTGCTLPNNLPVAVAANDNHIASCVVGPFTGIAGNNPNTATADGQYLGNPVADSDSAVYGTTALSIVKSATPTTYTAAGELINYSFVVTNTGAATLSGPIVVIDDLTSDEACPDLSTIGDGDNFFDPGESLLCTASYITTPADVSAGSVPNSAFATNGSTNSPPDTETISLIGPQLQLTKSASPTPFSVGFPASYTITVTNNGTAATSAPINVADTLPAGISLLGFSGTNWNCTGTSNLSCTFSGILNIGESTVLTLNVAVSAAASTGNNTAVASGGGDPTCPAAARCTGSVPVGVLSPLIVTTKTGILNNNVVPPSNQSDVGDVIDYTITVQNTGSGVATGITVNDPLLPVLSCTIAAIPTPLPTDLAAGATLVCTASYVLTAGDIGNGTVNNTATVTGTNTCPPGAGCAGTEITPLAALPILSLNKSASPTPFSVGQAASYSITVTNTGSVATSAPIVVDDNLPSGITLIGFSGTNWSCTGTTSISCTFSGTLNTGENTVLTLNVAVSSAATTGDNTAVASGGGDPTCPAATRCTGSVPVGILAPQIVTTKNGVLDNTVVAPSSQSNVGDTIDYTITVQNTGTGVATGITVSDPLLPVLSCTIAAIPTSLPTDLAAGSSLICTATYTLTAGDISTGSVINTATASGTNVCPPGPSCSGSTVTPLTLIPVLNVLKAATPNPFTVGQPASYTITVSNTGNTATTAPISVTDTLPSGITLTGFSGTNWSCTGTTSISCTFSGTLNSGANSVLTLDVAVTAAATNGNNTAVISGGGDPGCPAAPRCTSSVPVGVLVPQIVTTKSGVLDNSVVAPPSQSDVGDTIDYTITVQNTGTGVATGITVSDPLLPVLSCSIAAVPTALPTDLAAGASLICSATYTLTAGDISTGSVANTATVTGSNVCPPGPSCSGSTVTPLAVAPVLNVVKTATPNPFTVGQAASYTITVSNTGNAPSSAPIVMDDSLPAGISLSGFSGTNWNCTGTTTISCTFSGVLNSGENTVLTLDVVVTAAATNGDNTAVINGGGDPACPTAPRCTSTVPVGVLAPQIVTTKNGVLDSTVVPPSNQSDVGDTIDYTITVENTGTGVATGITVNDPLLPVLSCSIAAVPTALPTDLAAAATLICTATYTLTAGDISTGSVTNTATVNGTNVCPPGPSCSGSTTTPLAAVPILNLTKSATPNPFSVGVPASYSITVNNSGTAPTSAPITVSDSLPTGISLSGFSGANWNCTGTTVLSCSFSGILNPTESTVLSLTVVVSAAATTGDNTAVVSGGGDPTCPAAPRCTGSVPVGILAPQILTTKSGILDNTVVAPSNQSDVGDTIDYTITVQNAGTGVATGITVNDPLLPVLSCSIAAVPTTLPTDLAAGASLICTATYTLTAGDISTGSVTNTATVSGTNVCPPGPSCSGVAVTPLGLLPVLNVTKSASPVPFVVGQAASYSITVTNTGTVATSAPITVTDNLPVGITLLGFSGTNWSCVGTTNLTCTFSGTLNPAANTVLSLSVDVADTASSGDNSAVVNGGGDPTCPATPRCTGSVPVGVTRPDLTIDKFHLGDFTQGQSGAEYGMIVTNVGTAATAGTVSVSDNLPAGLSATAMSGTGWACDVGLLICSRSDPLAPGQSYPVISLIVDVAPNAPLSLLNIAVVSGGGDPNPTNDSDNDPVDLIAGEPIAVPLDNSYLLLLLAAALLLIGQMHLRKCMR